MRRHSYTFTTTVAFSEPVEAHAFVLRCVPQANQTQSVRAAVEIEPDLPFDLQTDGFGNEIVVGTISGPHDSFAFSSTGTVTCDLSRRAAETPHPVYSYPTRRTQMTPEMLALLADGAAADMRQLVLEGRATVGSTTFMCEHLMHMVHHILAYEPGSTTVATTAQEAFEQRAGVCQDFTHVLIALIRACGVPARYVSGLTVGEGTTHAWVEANLDGVWYGLDPTRDALVDEGYLKLAHGRDAFDCAVERGCFQGFVEQHQTVFAQVREA